MSEQSYFTQFVGEDTRGTRFMARFYSCLTVHGIVFDCVTYDECVSKAKNYSDYIPCEGAYIAIIELPNALDEVIRDKIYV